MAGKYVAGSYARKRMDPARWMDVHMRQWEQGQIERQRESSQTNEMVPTICFSRKIGVGALEVADLLGEKINYRVVDREILEHIARKAKISKKTVAFYDERYPGKRQELLSLLFREKSFIKSDYTRQLFSAVVAIAGLEPTIFVGRGAHLILPRDRVLAVRFICSNKHRIKRLAKIMKIDTDKAAKKLKKIDKEQRGFFKKAFGMKDASPYEFDLVINCDHIASAQCAADIVALAFKEKFASAV